MGDGELVAKTGDALSEGDGLGLVRSLHVHPITAAPAGAPGAGVGVAAHTSDGQNSTKKQTARPVAQPRQSRIQFTDTRDQPLPGITNCSTLSDGLTHPADGLETFTTHDSQPLKTTPIRRFHKLRNCSLSAFAPRAFSCLGIAECGLES